MVSETFLDFLLTGDKTGELHRIVAEQQADEARGITWGVFDGARLVETAPARYLAEFARHDLADAMDRPISDYQIREVTAMSGIDLSQTDPTIDLGNRVLLLLAEGYGGEQVAEIVGESPARAMEALVTYAHRVMHGTVPAHPSPECGSVPSYNGWCYVHGVFHPAVPA